MCGFRSFISKVDEKTLDRLISERSIWTVNAKNLEMGGETVLRLRRQCGMTQLQFAQLIGVTPITVSRWELGVTKPSMAWATHVRKAVGEYKEESKQERVAR
jgi:DNA-binding transcriptional regulator YiaG